MNIRRGFLALAAMILGVGFLGASPAKATPHYTPVAPCIDWNVASTVWAAANAGDTHFFICDGSYQNHSNPSAFAISGVRNATQAQSAVVRQKMLNNHVDVFVWKDHNAMNAYAGGNRADATMYGLTTEIMTPGSHPGMAIHIFEKDCPAPKPSGCTSLDYTFASRAVNHEVGHAVDLVSGNPSLMTGPGKFKTQFELDAQAFNALNPNTINWSGLPSGCASAGSNFLKLACWLNVPYAVGNDERYREYFAHCYSGKRASGGHPVQAVSLLNNYFSTGGMAPSSTVRSCSIADAAAQTP